MDQTPRTIATRIGTAACLAACALSIGLAQADDLVEPEVEPSSAAQSPSTTPWIQATMNADIRSKLAAAIPLAAARVESSPECAGLFAELGADGAQVLAGALYFSAPHLHIDQICRRATAYAYFGQQPTFLCSSFASLNDENAAMVLIHEALHHAGLPEGPAAPGGMGASAINEMVRKACGSQNVGPRPGRQLKEVRQRGDSTGALTALHSP